MINILKKWFCNHRWKELYKTSYHLTATESYSDYRFEGVITELLFECEKCGLIKKVKMRGRR